jgi:hypothetical protein
MDKYDVAEICLNGHVTTSMAASYPQFRKNFCDKCGEKTILNCQDCKSSIKGDYHMEGVLSFSSYKKPKFCESCGHPFPWTERQTIAAKNLIEITENLTTVEKDDFKDSIDELVKNSPNVIVAQAKYKKYITKAGKEIAQGLRDVLIDIVSETVKKALFGN